jgi:Holliday junction resolvase
MGCTMTASSYERELKGILSGREDVLFKVTKTCSDAEREGYYSIKERPFIVTRAAASLGVDIIALRGDISFPLEVKSSIKRVIRTSCNSGRETEQAENLMEMCATSGVLPVYAFRLKGVRGDSWRVFTLDMDPPKGIGGLIHSRLPKIRQTKKGNYVMEWEQGMPLSQFISYLS